MRDELFKKLTIIYTLFVAIYFYIAFSSPIKETTHRYKISPLTLRLIDVTILLPIVVIWAVAFYGYGRFANYVKTIKDHEDGKRLVWVSRGILVLAFTLPITEIVSSSQQLYSYKHLAFIPRMVIINNYIGVGLALITYILLSYGSRRLLKSTRDLKTLLIAEKATFWVIILFVILSRMYQFFVLREPNKYGPLNVPNHGLFYLPDFMIVLTILIPYMIAWLLGILASVYLYLYQRRLKGIIYKQGFRYIALGIAWLVGTNIIIQMLILIQASLVKLSIAPILLILYLLILLYIVGYALVALGAKRLNKIEVV